MMKPLKSGFREEALAFIQYDNESKQFVINEECCTFLRELEGPIGIISVAGLYRTGKSYLLNRMLLNRKSGFGVGPTVNPCTKGLWIWGSPIPGFTPEGEAINVLVIDTEGLGALDEDSNHDARIFSLALLLSSYFVYNSVGSIDETALQNLNLVVSLTKHIHLKSQGTAEEIDPEEYARYFPSFMWVVRDFTLQLVNEDGETISPKEYLEKALQPQKGFSEVVEQKNRVRTLLKTFFPDRDCCTMVRPVTKEEELQNLEVRELNDLRPEFVEQVMELRRKVINRIKPKTINGKKLNGDMLLNLAQNYVAAIKSGVVPNIENAWSYICKNECTKAFNGSLRAYEDFMKDVMEEKMPMDEMELKQFHNEARNTAFAEFKRVAVGNISADYLKDLSHKMKQKYIALKGENERESRKCVQSFLSQSYLSVEQRLKNGSFSSFIEYEKELRAFQIYCIEQGPPGPNRKALMLEFCQKATNEAAEIFSRNLSTELELQKTLSQEAIGKLEAQLSEVKDEARKDSDTLSIKIRNLESNVAEQSAKEQGLRENLNSVQKEKANIERELKEQLEEEKRESQRNIKMMRDKMNQQDEETRIIQEKMMTTESDFSKQQALYEQKIGFLEKSLEETRSKEKEYSNEIEMYINNLQDFE